MSQAIATPATPGLVRLVGRVRAARKGASIWRTLLTLPAADEFTFPPTVEVQSKGPLGKAGEAVDVVCNVIGFMNRPKPNPETGELYPPSARMVLQAVGA